MMITRRIAAGFALAAAPAIIALGAATASQAETSVTNTGPTASHHEVFPGQRNFPQPGTAAHHHHQNNRA
ncbi:hypothetical protein [Mycobacterium sp. 155]|uniref:hypothetical protein n=1 Tax=Mycobacterium sp. 155 TaxID=1157943 RepID=UPI0003694D52|nr:hypothetical protein [Mycobacterium sp. 155]